MDHGMHCWRRSATITSVKESRIVSEECLVYIRRVATADWPLAKPRMEPHETELLKAGTAETTAAAIPDISKARRNDQNDRISVRQPAEA
jgi:hypothetical protein